MSRRTLLLLALVATVAAVLALYLAFRPVPVKAPGGHVVSELTNPYVEHADAYDISASYPTTTPLAEGANDAAVTLMQGSVIGAVSDFKSSSGAGAQGAGRSTLDITYRTASSPRTVSYVFTINAYTGGTHGASDFKTFTFDTSTGAALSLSDLFAPKAGYLGQLSRIARAKLPSIVGTGADMQMIEDGTAPEEKDFEDWYLDGPNLVILFPPYQVAPYAAGAQTLSIPLSNLGNILQKGYGQ